MKRLIFLVLSVAVAAMSGCAPVKSYEKELHALKPMQLEDCPIHRFERNQAVYREGSAGGNGGKSGGGCGCS